jgi:hypothetical protein
VQDRAAAQLAFDREYAETGRRNISGMTIGENKIKKNKRDHGHLPLTLDNARINY